MAADQYGPDANGFLAGDSLEPGQRVLPSTGQSGSATGCDPWLVTWCVSLVHQRVF